jgi:hypothetical protein
MCEIITIPQIEEILSYIQTDHSFEEIESSFNYNPIILYEIVDNIKANIYNLKYLIQDFVNAKGNKQLSQQIEKTIITLVLPQKAKQLSHNGLTKFPNIYGKIVIPNISDTPLSEVIKPIFTKRFQMLDLNKLTLSKTSMNTIFEKRDNKRYKSAADTYFVQIYKRVNSKTKCSIINTLVITNEIGLSKADTATINFLENWRVFLNLKEEEICKIYFSVNGELSKVKNVCEGKCELKWTDLEDMTLMSKNKLNLKVLNNIKGKSQVRKRKKFLELASNSQ